MGNAAQAGRRQVPGRPAMAAVGPALGLDPVGGRSPLALTYMWACDRPRRHPFGALGGGRPSVSSHGLRPLGHRPPWTVAAPQQAHLLAPASSVVAETGVAPGRWHRQRALSRLRQ